MIKFKDIGVQVVRRTYKRGIYESKFYPSGPVEGFDIERDCGLGCTCTAFVSKVAEPTLSMAAGDVLCFNDSSRQGLSGNGCAGRVIKAGPDEWVFEIDARIVQAG